MARWYDVCLVCAHGALGSIPTRREYVGIKTVCYWKHWMFLKYSNCQLACALTIRIAEDKVCQLFPMHQPCSPSILWTVTLITSAIPGSPIGILILQMQEWGDKSNLLTVRASKTARTTGIEQLLSDRAGMHLSLGMHVTAVHAQSSKSQVVKFLWMCCLPMVSFSVWNV